MGSKQPFEKHDALTDIILHAANYWKVDDAWGNHLEQINKVCKEHADLLECLKGFSDALSSGNSKELHTYNLKSKHLLYKLISDNNETP